MSITGRINKLTALIKFIVCLNFKKIRNDLFKNTLDANEFLK